MINYTQHHAEYDARARVWQFNRDHLAGGRALSDGSYLTQFSVEADGGFRSRAKRAQGLYDSLPKRAIQVYSSQVFRTEPTRQLPDNVKAFEKDVDLFGTDAHQFFATVAEDAYLQGLSYVLVDAPPRSSDDAEPITEAERVGAGLRPWLEHVPVEKLIDWDVEYRDHRRRGRLNYVVLYEQIEEHPGPFERAKTLEVWRLYQWTPEGVLFQKLTRAPGDREPDAVVDTNLGVSEIPLVPFYCDRTGPFTGSTVLDDVCLAANALWHAASVRDEAFHWQGFRQTYITTDLDISKLKISESRAIPLQQGDDVKVVDPPVSAFDAYEKLMREIRERVADLVFNRTSRQNPTAQVESAEKRDLDRQEFLALLKRKAHSAQDAEQRCWELLAEFMGADARQVPELVTVEYEMDFRVNDRTIDEWVQAVEEGFFSREEAYQHYHPQSSDDEARNSIVGNLQSEKQLLRMRAQPDEALAGIVDELANRRATLGDDLEHEEDSA